MNMNLRTAIALGMGAVLVAGCQSATRIGGVKVQLRDADLARQAQADYGGQQLEAGRQALDSGDVSAAIAAFRNAKYAPEHAPAAFNGLAVAYSMLGRADLAERYFRQAIVLAPEEARYQANLARFYRQAPKIPVSPDARPAAAPLQAAAPARSSPVTVQYAPVRVAEGVHALRPENRMVRVSANEVRIGPADAAPRGPSRALAWAESPRQSGAYPVRVPLRTTGSERSAAPAYPVRVRLGSAAE